MLDEPPAALIEDEVHKARAAGPLSGFADKVAANASGIAARERDLGHVMAEAEVARLQDCLRRGGELAELNAELACRIHEGADITDDLLAHLVLTTIDKLRVDQPSYPGFAALSGR
ncbi:MAG: DUF6285 domain-containing protein [Tsuneonella sp.]